MTLHIAAPCDEITSSPVAHTFASRTFKQTGTLPEELTDTAHWICWQYVTKGPGEKASKVPCTPSGGPLRAWQRDPAQWMTYEGAVECYERNPALSGIGFVLTPDLGIVGVDMDHAIDLATGEVAQWATEHIQEFDCYTEVSPSGQGFRAFAHGTLPDGCPKKNGRREIYNGGRWLTVTGNVWHDARIEARPEAIARYIAAMTHTPNGNAPSVDSCGPSMGSNAELVRRVLSGDNLHDSTRDIVFRLTDDGMQPGKVVEFVRGIMEAMPDRGDLGRWQARYNDIPNLVRGAVAKKAPPDNTPSKRLLNLVRVDQIQLTPIAWLIRDYLAIDTLASAFGPSSAGKTFIVLGMVCAIGTGTPWHGREVHKGAVFYIAGEGQRGLKKRISGWEKHNGISTDGAPIYISGGLPFLCDLGTANAVADEIAEEADRLFQESGIRPVLIVVDTVARAMAGANENSTEDMGMFIRACDLLRQRWGCTVLCVHHTGHQAPDRGRGSSALYAALDSEFSVVKKGEAVLFSGTKYKDWPQPSPISFQKVIVPIMVPTEDGDTIEESSLVMHDIAGSMLEQSKRDQAAELHRAGQTLRAISVQLGVSKSTIGNWLKCT